MARERRGRQMNERDFLLSFFPQNTALGYLTRERFCPFGKPPDWVDLELGKGNESRRPNPLSFYFPLVLGALGVGHLVMNAALRTIKIPKEYMNEDILFLCMPFMWSSLIILPLVVLQTYLKMEYSCERSC